MLNMVKLNMNNIAYRVNWERTYFEEIADELKGQTIFRGSLDDVIKNISWRWKDKILIKGDFPPHINIFSGPIIVLYKGIDNLDSYLGGQEQKYIEESSKEKYFFRDLSSEEMHLAWEELVVTNMSQYSLPELHEKVLPLFGYFPYEKRRN